MEPFSLNELSKTPQNQQWFNIWTDRGCCGKNYTFDWEYSLFCLRNECTV